METNPPPYSPQYSPSAPTADQMMQTHSNQFTVPPSYGTPQPQIIPVSYGQPAIAPVVALPITPPSSLSGLNPAMGGSAFPSPQVAPVMPIRCMAGNVEIASGTSSNLETIGSWTPQYVEVRDGVLFMCTSAVKRNQPSIVRQLQNQFISMPQKRLVAIEDNTSSVIMKAPSEVRAHKWFMTLSQYCFVAPTMEGYAHKMSGRKKVFEERFLRLSSEGVLSWYRTHLEDSDRRGSIQVRGQTCGIDTSNPTKINVQVMPRTYQFQFSTAREAQLWLTALQWHYGRKTMRKAQVPLRNKAK